MGLFTPSSEKLYRKGLRAEKKKDYKLALSLFEEAISSKNYPLVEAVSKCAEYYAKGIGTERDLDKAIYYAELCSKHYGKLKISYKELIAEREATRIASAETADSTTQIMLARDYLYGKITIKNDRSNIENATYWYNKAMEKGATYVSYAEYVKVNNPGKESARDWNIVGELEANFGYDLVTRVLDKSISSSPESVERLKKAREWFTKAEEHGYDYDNYLNIHWGEDDYGKKGESIMVLLEEEIAKRENSTSLREKLFKEYLPDKKTAQKMLENATMLNDGIKKQHDILIALLALGEFDERDIKEAQEKYLEYAKRKEKPTKEELINKFYDSLCQGMDVTDDELQPPSQESEKNYQEGYMYELQGNFKDSLKYYRLSAKEGHMLAAWRLTHIFSLGGNLNNRMVKSSKAERDEWSNLCKPINNWRMMSALILRGNIRPLIDWLPRPSPMDRAVFNSCNRYLNTYMEKPSYPANVWLSIYYSSLDVKYLEERFNDNKSMLERAGLDTEPLARVISGEKARNRRIELEAMREYAMQEEMEEAGTQDWESSDYQSYGSTGSTVASLPFIVYDDNNNRWTRRGVFGDHAEYYNANGDTMTIYNADISGSSATTSAGNVHWY